MKKFLVVIVFLSSCAGLNHNLTPLQENKFRRCIGRISVEQCGVNYLQGNIASTICVNQLSNEYYKNPSDEWLFEHGCPSSMIGK
jgi:hypothetical protein